MLLARVLKSRSAAPWERSVLELIVELDIPDFKSIKARLNELKAIHSQA